MKVHTLMSGSSGNAIYIEGDGTRILVDAGQPGRNITQALDKGCGVNPQELHGIVVTHAHRDHVSGVGVLSRRYGLPVYATAGTWLEMKGLIGEIRAENMRILDCQGVCEVHTLQLVTFPTSHDALESVGIVCHSSRESIGVATDTGIFTTVMEAALKNLDCLILESNHDLRMLFDGPYPWSLKKRISSDTGHLSNEASGQSLLKIIGERTKTVILAHLSEENNKPRLALNTVRAILEKEQVCLANLDITTAPRNVPSRCFSIERS